MTPYRSSGREVVPAAPRQRDLAPSLVGDGDARLVVLDDLADLGAGRIRGAAERLDGGARGDEDELVVLAAAEGEAEGLGGEGAAQRGAGRHAVGVDADADAAGPRDVAQVLDEAVADIDGAADAGADGGLAESDAGLGALVGGGGGEAGRATDVAPADGHAEGIGRLLQAAVERDGVLNAEVVRQHEGDEREMGRAAPGGAAARVAGGPLPADVAPGGLGKKVDAGDERVGGPDEGALAPRADQGVVAEADDEAGGHKAAALRRVFGAELLGQEMDEAELADLGDAHGSIIGCELSPRAGRGV